MGNDCACLFWPFQKKKTQEKKPRDTTPQAHKRSLFSCIPEVFLSSKLNDYNVRISSNHKLGRTLKLITWCVAWLANVQETRDMVHL